MHLPSSVAAPTLLRTLVLTDLVGSTGHVARLGDAAAALLFARADRIARDLLAAHSGREIDKSDGFLFLFERPLDAVRWALAYHDALASFDLAARVGIHLGEVVVRENAPEDVARGAKPLEIEGLAKPLAARVMSVAVGAQTLLTRGTFDLARRSAVGADHLPSDAQWRAHGLYAFQGIDDPVELYEVGREGRAPLTAPPSGDKAHRALRPGEEGLLGWRPAPGQSVRRRPGWTIDRKLGEGGFGEVWLARHELTREQRVFKFCFAYERLRSLKRELTIFLLMKEALGARDDIQRLHDLNFDEPPYFLEMDYSEGGDLSQWAEAEGGIASVPLATRLELVAQAAEAVAAAHSIGIIHKDIKPSNILVESSCGAPRARLTDFGIGQLADRSVLEQVKIAATGFTAGTLEQTDLSSRTGTRLYMAPELLAAGGLPSIQSDVYALGVVLHQMIGADLAAPITTDWRERARRAGADAVLLEDLAACLAGEAGERLSSAGELARRLRTLGARRRVRRLRNLTRAGVVASLVLAVLLAVAFVVIRREQARADLEAGLRAEADAAREVAEGNERRAIAAESDALAARDSAEAALLAAEEARHEAEARRDEAERNLTIARTQGEGAFDLVNFVLHDLKRAMDEELTTDRGIPAAVANEIAHAIAGRVAAPVEGYFVRADSATWPETLQLRHAAQLLQTSARLQELARLEESERLTSLSLRLRERLLRPDDPDLATTLHALGRILSARGHHAEAEPHMQRALAIRERVLGPDHMETAASLGDLANLLYNLDRLDEVEPLHLRSLEIRRKVHGPDSSATIGVHNDLGNLYAAMGRNEEAEVQYRLALTERERVLSPDHPDVAVSLSNLASHLNRMGDPRAAEPLLRRALAICERHYGPDHPMTHGNIWALLRLPTDTTSTEEQARLLRRIAAADEKVLGPDHPDLAVTLNSLALRLLDLGEHEEAEATFQRAHAILLAAFGREHSRPVAVTVNLAQLELARGRLAEAEALAREALDIRSRLASAAPEDVDRRMARGRALALLKRVLRARGDHVAELVVLQETQAWLEEALARDPTSSSILWALAICRNDQGRVHMMEGRYEEARVAYQADVELSTRGAAAHPTDPKWTMGLGIAWCCLGSAQALLGAGDARDAASIAGLEAIDASGLDVRDYTHAFGRFDVAAALAHRGRVEEARTLLLAVLEEGRIDETFGAVAPAFRALCAELGLPAQGEEPRGGGGGG